MSDIFCNIVIEQDYSAYAQFIDYTWTENMFNKVRHTPLEKIVGRLILHWKSANLTHHMPHLMVNCIASMAKGMINTEKPSALQLVNTLSHRVTTDQKLSVDEQARNCFVNWLGEIEDDINLQITHISNSIDESELFQRFIRESEFQIAIWSGQRQAYSSLYFGYEFFVLSLIHHIRPELKGFRMNNPNLKSELRGVFGEIVATKCWLDSRRNNAESIRHAIVHAGGIETDDLKKRKHGISVIDGVLQVQPSDNRQLYLLLKSMADMLINHCLGA